MGERLRLHVLVAEDEVLHQAVARRLLAAAGHECTVVADGQQLLDALALGRFDLLLLDLEMPVLDGLAALRRALARDPDRVPPVAVVTGVPLERAEAPAIAAGAGLVFEKPLTRAKLAGITASFGLVTRS